MRSQQLRFVLACAATAALAIPASAQTLEWVYAVPYVCGYQAPITTGGEPVVKPGNYATEIDVHNPHYVNVDVRKKFVPLVINGSPVGREPNQRPPAAFDGINLGPDYATMDDCLRIWQLLNPGIIPPTPMPLNKGYVVFLSKETLDVDAIYTAVVPGNNATTALTGNSIDVERIEGKQVVVPLTATPRTDTPEASQR
jgi:hypothetical protein